MCLCVCVCVPVCVRACFFVSIARAKLLCVVCACTLLASTESANRLANETASSFGGQETQQRLPSC